MTYVERTDDDLLALAREGVAPAFAVLLSRYGPEVLGMADRDPDPIGATVATFVRAMRALPDADPEDVRGWLLTIAAGEIDGDVAIPPQLATVGAQAPTDAAAQAPTDDAAQAPTDDATSVRGHGTIDAPALESDEDLDEVWAELALRWPTGKVPRHLPSWAIWLLTTLALVALAIALPWAILGASTEEEDAVEELRASPVHDDLTFQEEVVEEDEEPEPLPTFDFPGAPTDEAPDPEPDPEPEAPATPAPPPTPAPGTAPETEEEPADEGDTGGGDPGDEGGEGDGTDDADTDDPDDPDDDDENDGDEASASDELPIQLPIDEDEP